MRIVQIAPLEEPVPPEKYGGIELVIYNITEGMVKAGHEVYLLASGDSLTSAHLVPIIPQAIRKAYTDPADIEKWRNFLKVYNTTTVVRHISALKPDIIHNHCSWRILQYADYINYPMMHTVHGPIGSVKERYALSQNSNANYISISNNQREAMPYINWVRTIYNGIDTSWYKSSPLEERQYFAFLGRTSPEKGLKEICEMIRKTSHTLKIAAKVDPVDRVYFEEEIRPLIDGEQIEFVGEINLEEKVKFLRKAKGLLLWLNWEEPFGLVVTEAMASGTPVIVNKRGAMPEIVKNGKTGFLVDSIEEMRSKLDMVHMINPHTCRHHVDTYFSQKTMTEHYLETAQELVNDYKGYYRKPYSTTDRLKWR